MNFVVRPKKCRITKCKNKVIHVYDLLPTIHILHVLIYLYFYLGILEGKHKKKRRKKAKKRYVYIVSIEFTGV